MSEKRRMGERQEIRLLARLRGRAATGGLGTDDAYVYEDIAYARSDSGK